MTTRATALAASIVLAFSCSPATAYVYWECDGKKLAFKSDPITVRAGAVTFPEGDPFRAALASVVDSINSNPSNARLRLALDDHSDDLDNGKNQIVGLAGKTVGDELAVTLWSYDCGDGEITEADILFNADNPWTSTTLKAYLQPYGGEAIPFDAIAKHEFGHFLGLDHNDAVYTIMYSWAHAHANGPNAVSYQGEDVANGLVFLYGYEETRPQDLAVSHWRHAYSPVAGPLGHMRTTVHDHSPVDPIWWSDMMGLVDGFVAYRDHLSEPRFLVYNGQRIFPDFTYENLGADSQSTKVGFYLSPDDDITSDDRLIGQASLRLGRDSPYSKELAVALPADLVEGRDYQLGVVVDKDRELAEVDETNNATYVGIRIAPAQVTDLVFEPRRVEGGKPTTGTVTLSGAAPAGGVIVELSTTDHFVQVPSSVVVPAGSKSARFNVTTSPVATEGYHTAVVEASRAGVGEAVHGPIDIKGYIEIRGYIEQRYDQTFCQAHPQSAICLLCAKDPTRPACQ